MQQEASSLVNAHWLSIWKTIWFFFIWLLRGWKMELVSLAPFGALAVCRSHAWSTSNLRLWLHLWAHTCWCWVEGQSFLLCAFSVMYLPVTSFASCCAVGIRSPRLILKHLASVITYWNLPSVKNKLHPKTHLNINHMLQPRERELWKKVFHKDPINFHLLDEELDSSPVLNIIFELW